MKPYTKKSLILLISSMVMLAMTFAFMSIKDVKATTAYYVDTGGNDSNNGTSENLPFRTLVKALSSVSNGDKIILDSGTFTECGPFVIDNYGITIQGASDGGTKIKRDTESTCSALDSDYDGTAFLLKTTDVNETDDKLDLTMTHLEINDFRFGIRTEEQTSVSNALLTKVKINNVQFENIGKDSVSISSCDIDESTVISPFRDAQDAVKATGTKGGLIFTADNAGVDGEAITIVIVDGANCDITNDTTGACTSVSTNTITVTADLSDANGDDTDTDTVTWAMIQTSLSGDGGATALVDITGTASGNGTAGTTSLSLGDGAALLLQNLADINLSSIEIKSSSHGIYIENKNGQELSDISLSKITIDELEHTGIIIIGKDDGDGLTLSDTTIDDPNGCGLSLQNIEDESATVSKITINNPQKQGIYGSDLVEMDFSTITINKPEEEGIFITGTDNEGLILQSITVNKAQSTGISISNANKGELHNSTVASGEEKGVVIDDCESFKVYSNTISGNTKIGLSFDGESIEGDIYDNTIFNNEDYGVSFDTSIEDTLFYSNSVYSNKGSNNLQVQDNSDDTDGVQMYNIDASGPYKKGNYYGPFKQSDTDFDGIADTGYLPDDTDEHYDEYAVLTSAQALQTMNMNIQYTTYNIPYTAIENGKGLKTVKACVREKGTNENYTCHLDTDTVSPVTGVTGVAGKSYDVIVVASDIYDNGENEPSKDSKAELVVNINANASGIETQPTSVITSLSTDTTSLTASSTINTLAANHLALLSSKSQLKAGSDSDFSTLTATVKDTSGNTLQDVLVLFDIISGTGDLAPVGSSMTDENGEIESIYTPGNEVELALIKAYVKDKPSVFGTANINIVSDEVITSTLRPSAILERTNIAATLRIISSQFSVNGGTVIVKVEDKDGNYVKDGTKVTLKISKASKVSLFIPTVYAAEDKQYSSTTLNGIATFAIPKEDIQEGSEYILVASASGVNNSTISSNENIVSTGRVLGADLPQTGAVHWIIVILALGIALFFERKNRILQ